MANYNKSIKDISNIGFFIGYMKKRLEYSNYQCKKGISNKLSGLISQYKSHIKSCPFEDFLIFQQKHTDKPSSDLPNTGFVYFIGNLDNEMVKIGYSVKVNRRLKELQSSSPIKLKVIHKMSANKQFERELHSKFDEYRSHGEWFSMKGRLKDFLIDKKSIV